MCISLQLLSDNNLCRKQNHTLNIVYAAIRGRYCILVLFKISEKLHRLRITDKGHCDIICFYRIYGLPIRFIQTCICSHLIKRVDIQMILWGFVLYNIMSSKYRPYFIISSNTFILFDYQKVNLQRLRIQIIFLDKYQVIPIFCQFEIHRRDKPRMPLYLCIFHP